MGRSNQQRPSAFSSHLHSSLIRWKLRYVRDGNDTQAGIKIASKSSKESEKAKMSREDACYDIIDETKRVNVKNGFMTYTKQVKYLGSYISYSLQDMISKLKPTAISHLPSFPKEYGQPKSEGNESNKQTSQKTITMCRENDRSTTIIAAQLLFTGEENIPQ